MRNSQLKPGYNIQIGVSGKYIVGVDISSERSDQLALIPLSRMRAMKAKRTILIWKAKSTVRYRVSEADRFFFRCKSHKNHHK